MIQWIQLTRLVTGCGLQEARDAVHAAKKTFCLDNGDIQSLSYMNDVLPKLIALAKNPSVAKLVIEKDEEVELEFLGKNDVRIKRVVCKAYPGQKVSDGTNSFVAVEIDSKGALLWGSFQGIAYDDLDVDDNGMIILPDVIDHWRNSA